MQIKTLFSIVTLALVIMIPVSAQEQESGSSKTISLDFSMENLSAGDVRARTGVVLEDFLTIGIAWGLGFDTVGSAMANELAVGIWSEVALLKEDDLIPVSIDISAQFDKSRTNGSYLRANDLMMSGTGYTIGISASKRFILSETSMLDTALRARYEFDTVTTEAIPGSGSPFTTVIESVADYLYGIHVAAGVALNEAIDFRFGAFAYLDGSFDVVYGPVFGLMTN